MSFHDPQWLLLLVLLIPWALWSRREQGGVALPVADGDQIAALPDTPRVRAHRLLPALRLLVLLLGILALARPQMIERESTEYREGVDLVAVLDLSTSMLAEDRSVGMATPATPVAAGTNRLKMAKDVLGNFLGNRPGDRIGLIAFAARPYPAAPLTLDHDWLKTAVASLQAGAIEDGTALGDAILAAVNRLRAQPIAGQEGTTLTGLPRSQAIILITDGRSNVGAVTPQMAAAAAKALAIRIHAIGIGSRGQAVVPMVDPLGATVYRSVTADLDEATLREIATISGGGYFRADDRDMLAAVFQEIDRLEKRPVEHKVYFSYRELFAPLLLAALALAAMELVLRATLLRRLP